MLRLLVYHYLLQQEMTLGNGSSLGLGVNRFGLKFFCKLPAVWSWTIYLTSLILSFPHPWKDSNHDKTYFARFLWRLYIQHSVWHILDKQQMMLVLFLFLSLVFLLPSNSESHSSYQWTSSIVLPSILHPLLSSW